MKVAVIVKLNNGCDFYRCVLPVEYIPFEKGSFKLFYNDSIDIPEDQLDFADNLKNLESFNPSIIFFSRTISNNNDLDLLEVWKNKGIKIVMDIDDYWEMGTSNYLYKWWYKTEMNKKLINNMKIADLVITTNEQLYEKIIPINRNCIIIPNAVPFGEPYYCKDENIKVSTTHRKMNFLYAGGSTHANDVAILRNKFDRIGGDKHIQDRARFILAGYNPIKDLSVYCEWDKMENVFKRTKSYEIMNTRPIEEHMVFYDVADVVLAPLLNNEFNACKSELKIIEAATRELPVIASKVKPFTILDGYSIMWDNWLEHIKFCIKNPNAIKDMGKELAEQMKKTHDIRIWSQSRYDIFKHLNK